MQASLLISRSHFLAVTAVSGESCAMFAAAIVSGIADVASSIPRLVRVEVGECPVSAFRQGAYIAVVRVPAIIDVAVEAVRAVEPGAGSDEHSVHEPIGTVIAVGSTVIRSIVEVSIWAYGRGPNVDRNLGRCHARTTH